MKETPVTERQWTPGHMAATPEKLVEERDRLRAALERAEQRLRSIAEATGSGEIGMAANDARDALKEPEHD